MKVKIVQRKNPQKPDEPGKFYGQPVLDGVAGMDMICRQIAGRSSLTAGDVKNVLTNFLDELPTYMLMNRSVQLEDFGILRISFGSEGVDRAEDFSSSLIRGVKIVFTPKLFAKLSTTSCIIHPLFPCVLELLLYQKFTCLQSKK